MRNKQIHQGSIKRLATPLILSVGITAGTIGELSWAQGNAPAEHKGLEVEQLGFVPAESMEKQTGLNGHKLLLRRITISPGGQIAKHSHESVPGVVYLDSGEWIEGRDSRETDSSALDAFIEDAKHSRLSSPGVVYINSSETAYSAGDTFIEDVETVHWFFNRGDEPAVAYVCDIKEI